MGKGRLEAFSDGVIAILITIMVLELKLPADATFAALGQTLPILLSYLLSFVFLGIYWNNHHHMLHAAEHVNGAILWANLHLLFWLSLVPFATRWIGETHEAPVPVAAYGIVLFCSAVAYTILQTLIIRLAGPESKLARAVQDDVKGKSSIALYLAAIALAFVQPLVSIAIYATVAMIWLVPDRRIEAMLGRR